MHSLMTRTSSALLTDTEGTQIRGAAERRGGQRAGEKGRRMTTDDTMKEKVPRFPYHFSHPVPVYAVPAAPVPRVPDPQLLR